VSRSELVKLLQQSGGLTTTPVDDIVLRRDIEERGLLGKIANVTESGIKSGIVSKIGDVVEHILPDLFIADDSGDEQTGTPTSRDLSERGLFGDIANITESGVKSGIISKIGDAVKDILPDFLIAEDGSAKEQTGTTTEREFVQRSSTQRDDSIDERGLFGDIANITKSGIIGKIGEGVADILPDLFLAADDTNEQTGNPAARGLVERQFRNEAGGSDGELNSTVAERLSDLPVNEDIHISSKVKTAGKIAGGAGLLSGLGSLFNISSIF
jgi:hypothetical protein